MADSSNGLLDVSIGVIVDRTQVLIARRKAGDSLGGYWEFPGGKVEPGETAEVALLRELNEELALTCAIVERLAPFEFSYPQRVIRLTPFIVRIVSGTPAALDSDEIRWVSIDALHEYRFPPANRSLIDSLQRRFRTSGRVD